MLEHDGSRIVGEVQSQSSGVHMAGSEFQQYYSLTVIYFDTSKFLNSDIAFLANFFNSNRKLKVRFEYLNLDLYFLDNLIATQAVQPHAQRSRDTVIIGSHDIKYGLYATNSCSGASETGAEKPHRIQQQRNFQSKNCKN